MLYLVNQKGGVPMERMKRRFGVLAVIALVAIAFAAVSAFASRAVYQNSIPAYYAGLV